ncbi:MULTISPECIES: hypothetical protein [unclassified Devosia]|uniref:hypothetical protein n=1 Tax=unclassified Devosia TaxID=196773 RepID=UPI000FD6C58D|nr:MULTISPECIES: hypothetical protein [unclassified Devosia]
MSTNQTLTRHRDIQVWVTGRRGRPAIARIRNPDGQQRAQLRLSFGSPVSDKRDPAALDDGVSPCSWAAWLAELDRQRLALRIDPAAGAFELVDRNAQN